jgi:plastocyanin
MSDETRVTKLHGENPGSATVRVALALRVGGAGLLAATAGIHLDLYLTGYRQIPTIGPLFLVQVISALVLAVAVLATPLRLVAAAGAGFAASTLGGYVLSLWIGLFGFNEVRTTAGIVAGAFEVATIVLLGAAAAFGTPARTWPKGLPQQTLERMARRAVAPAGMLALLVLVLAVANSPGAPSGASASRGTGGGTGTTEKVTISNFAFHPAHFSVAPGEAIAVTNRDGVAHTFSPMTGSPGYGTSDIAPGHTVVVDAPRAAGTYSFFCKIHPFMTGSFTVS